MNLTELVLDILCDHQSGMNHPQLVRSVLERGYDDRELSSKVHTAVTQLARSGVIHKNLETRIIRCNELQCAR